MYRAILGQSISLTQVFYIQYAVMTFSTRASRSMSLNVVVVVVVVVVVLVGTLSKNSLEHTV